MKKIIFLSLVACFSMVQLGFAKDYEIDATHSNVGFMAKHLISKVNGEFKDYNGTISFDPKKPDQTKVNAKVKAASINTNVEKRDAHLKSEEFFGVEKFPELTFVSTKVTPNGSKKYKMVGDLTMHGVTKPVTFEVEYLGEMDDPWGGHRAGFTATTQVNRKDFGMNWNKALDKGGVVLSDEIAINLNIEALEKKK